MPQIAIKAQNLSKRYRLGQIGISSLREEAENLLQKLRNKKDPTPGSRDFWALKDINFEIEDGDVIGIIGRNGAGKSTLLKLISRITTPSAGEIHLRGKVAALLEVGTGFHQELTGRENIYLNGTILGMKKREIDRKLDEIINFSGVEKHIDTPVKRYSSGMNVRLGFAVAAHLEPEILIVDEVLAVGDLAFQKKCLDKMKEISSSGRTVLFVSHNMVSIQTICRKTILLSKGQIESYDLTDRVIKQYLRGDNSEAQIPNTFNPVESSENGGIRLNSAKLLTRVATGLPMEIELILQNHSNERIEALISFGFRNTMDEPVLQLFSDHQNVRFELDAQSEYRANCKIPSFLLAPGEYLMNIWIGDENETLCFYKRAFLLHVEDGSYIKHGKMLRDTKFPVLAQGNWDVRKEENLTQS